MNIEFSKIKSPFHPDHDHMSDLAMRIQRKVGIEAQELFEKPELKEPVIPRNPVQLSVEFGNSYVAESPEDTYIESEAIEQTAETEIAEQEAASSELEESKALEEATIDSSLADVRESELQSIQEKDERARFNQNSQQNEVLIESPNNLPLQTPEEVKSPEEIESEKIRSAEVERKRAEAAARYAALLDESRADYVPVAASNTEPEKEGLPWASILGVVASLAAIATAWWVWSLIQAPMSVEQMAESSRQIPVTQVVEPVPVAAATDNSVSFDNLPAEAQIIADVMEEGEVGVGSMQTPKLSHFTQMDEQSKVSMVELENKGLLIMELEDEIFEDQWL